MRIVNGIELDDGVDEPGDYCEECGECYCVCITEQELKTARDARRLAAAMQNNRPQDGRVCDCEDAPCCGHYEL